MEDRRHRVIGLYPERAPAEAARDEVLAGGLASAQVRLLVPGSPPGRTDLRTDSDDVLKDMLRDGAIGVTAGTAAGAGVTIALAAANLTLFVASPVLGALYLLGWGASLGGLMGAAVGSERSKGDVPALVKDALANGHFVLVVRAADMAQASLAQHIIGTSMAGVDGTPAPREAQSSSSTVSVR